MFERFRLDYAEVADGVRLRYRIGGGRAGASEQASASQQAAGNATPVVLLHGHPRTHTTWHRVAPRLADAGFTVVCPDLRGYGRSTSPPPQPDHAQAGKRAMAADIRNLMGQLGHPRFAVAGHDRGSYVAFRLAMDHPAAVTRLAVLDCVPIGEALARADARFAEAWWHWFFFAQPEKPERAITADPDAWYRTGPELATSMGTENYADFYAAIHDPAVVRAMLEDYRAGLTVDRAADDADRAAGRRLGCPVLVGWSTEDDLTDLYGDLLPIWRNWADHLRTVAIPSGHHMAEQAPEQLAAALAGFFGAQ